MQIKSVKINNFKRVQETEIHLGKITYLVGGNNSGKSSVLQAIHMAVSCAQISSELQQQVIAESSLRYSPTAEFQTLGNSGPYENRKEGSRGTIEFFGSTTDGADASYKVEIYKARNYHNIGVDRSGVSPGFGQYISDSKSLFSVYVPGLAGIPHREEMQGYASVFKRAAGGDANFVFRNIIRLISEKGKIEELEDLLFDVIGPTKFRIEFDPNRDLYVDVKIALGDQPFVPVDLCGTGVIQITQIISYAILFNPKLLLVDEPDSHLHPSRQSLLADALAKIVDRYDCNIIVSTHSRHLVSAARDGTKLIWLRNGRVETQDKDDLTQILLDLGALDQIDSSGAEIIICTEDKGKENLSRFIKRLDLDEKIKIISYNGVTNAASAVAIKAMADLFSKSPKIIIHRDRDFLSDDEVEIWGKEYTNRGMTIFCPKLSDIESYYVQPKHIAETYLVSEEDAKQKIGSVISGIEDKLRKKFSEKRREAIQRYWKDGGGPATGNLWPDSTPPTEATILGKLLMSAVNEASHELFGRRENLNTLPSANLMKELNEMLESLPD
ncbi:putative ATPase [Neorhizobium huautlense]|uniref:ATPase n=1 Tax=Neorhizobium huautlense TaxID=67774 RepID=A0ABT9PUC9_9HYPH|nr:AAA family ATPase [Neorhizobium huautlense]MDP9838076.1 putative ATPase [Neorhizobium huautlense]